MCECVSDRFPQLIKLLYINSGFMLRLILLLELLSIFPFICRHCQLNLVIPMSYYYSDFPCDAGKEMKKLILYVICQYSFMLHTEMLAPRPNNRQKWAVLQIIMRNFINFICKFMCDIRC